MSGIVRYDESKNCFIVVRKSENLERTIRCRNFDRGSYKHFGLETNRDVIYLLVGPKQNSRPNKKFIYKFSTLSGGPSKSI